MRTPQKPTLRVIPGSFLIVLLASLALVAHPAPPSTAQVPAKAGASPAEKEQSKWIEEVKTIAETWEAVLTGAALIVGGLWTYLLVVKKREIIPRAKVTHEIIQHPLNGGRRLLHVFTRVSNSSQVLLSVVSGFCRVQQVLPVPREFAKTVESEEDPVPADQTEYDWPLLGERNFPWEGSPRELEPGESDEILCDFVIDAEAQVIEVYTYLKNEQKRGREIGWHLTTFYDLQGRKVLSPAGPRPSARKKGPEPEGEEENE